LGLSVTGSISPDPFKTYSGLLRLLTYAGVFWLSLQFCRSRERAQQVIITISLIGLVYAGYGLFVEFTGSETILWFKKTAYLENLTSTFVNRNSYATYAGLGLICATGMIFKLVGDLGGEHISLRETIRAVVLRLLGQGWPFIVAWFVIFVALLLTGSRGGFLATAAGLVTLFIAVGVAASGEYKFSKKLAGAAALVAVGFLILSGGVTLDRLAQTAEKSDLRPQIYEQTTTAISDSPWLGTGFGTFNDVFRIYRTSAFGVTVAKAHNTYLENTLELGIPGSVALTLSVVCLFILCVMGIRRRRRDAIYPSIGIAASVLVGSHALVDFSLQIPAVTLTYCLLMGAACAQSWSSRRPTD